MFFPLYSSTRNLDLLSEVFKTETVQTDSKMTGMEEENYKTRLKAVNIAERKVKAKVS